jgi:hypothetical protein
MVRMFDADDIRDWRGSSVVDQDGARIGSLEAIYVDTASSEPVFATVKVGLPGGGRLVFVPLAGARLSPKRVRVMTNKKLAKEAPSIAPDGELEAIGEPGIYAHYGMAYEVGAGGERRLGRR